VATLDLQNGPDAVRLVWPDGAIEVVGWGALESPEYHCGDPAIDVVSGQSLARVPESAASGSNAGDFRPAEPSPGNANLRERDAAVVRNSLALTPEQPEAASRATVTLLLTNQGAAAWNDGEARVQFSGELLPAPLEQSAPALAAGETTLVQVALDVVREGRAELAARVLLTGDQAPLNDLDTLLVRIGRGPLELSEIQFHPAAAEGEWVEVRNRARESLALDGFRVGDRAGAAGRIEGGALLEPESLAVLAQDPTALLMAYPSLDATRVRRHAVGRAQQQ
jgi:hypothetical protein